MEIHAIFVEQLKKVWLNYYEVKDLEDETLDYFYAKDKNMFDNMDMQGFYLDQDGQGPFLIMIGNEGVTVVLPAEIEDNSFSKIIYDMVVYAIT